MNFCACRDPRQGVEKNGEVSVIITMYDDNVTSPAGIAASSIRIDWAYRHRLLPYGEHKGNFGLVGG